MVYFLVSLSNLLPDEVHLLKKKDFYIFCMHCHRRQTRKVFGTRTVCSGEFESMDLDTKLTASTTGKVYVCFVLFLKKKFYYYETGTKYSMCHIWHSDMARLTHGIIVSEGSFIWVAIPCIVAQKCIVTYF